MLTLGRTVVEQIFSDEERVYLTYTTDEYGKICQRMSEARVIFWRGDSIACVFIYC